MGDMTKFVVTQVGPSATEALSRIVADLQRDDPLRPVDVVVPSALAGVTLRRTLAEPATANVRFGSLPQVANRLARRAMALAHLRPLTEPARVLAARQAVSRQPHQPGSLAAAAAHPATASLITALLAELDEVDAHARHDELAGTGARAAEVAGLHADFRQACAGLQTPADIARLAAKAVREGTAPETTVVLFVPSRLSPAERGLVEALALAERLVCVLAEPKESGQHDDLERWLTDLLGSPERLDASRDSQEIMLTLAPDAEEEVREAVRRVLSFLTEHPVRPERIAIAYRSATPYSRLLDEQLTVAGLPFHVSGGRKLVDSVAGRTLVRLLQLHLDDYPRAALLSWVADAPIVTADGAPVPVDRWERISRSAGVSRGLDTWRRRLDTYTADEIARREEPSLSLSPEDQEARRAHHDHRIQECHELKAFVDSVAETCEAVADAPSWADVARGLRDAVIRFLGDPRRADRWVVDDEARRWRRVERAGYDGVLTAIDRLTLLDDVAAGKPSFDTVLEAVSRELDTSLAGGTTLGRGMAVTPLADLAGADLDLLVVLGMTEDAFPPRAREHPVLGDEARRAIPGLLTTTDRRAAERDAFLAAKASAHRVVLSAPQADVRAQRALQPSPWFMEEVARREGRLVTSRELPTMDRPWLRRHDSFEQALRRTGVPASTQELDVLLALTDRGHELESHDDRYARSRVAVQERRDATYGEWTGHVADLPVAVRESVDANLSASTLQTFATCPRRFWLDRILRVSQLEDPGDEDTLDAMRRGSLVHTVLERFFVECLPQDGPPARPGRSPDQPWTDADVARVHALLDEEAATLEGQGVTGRPLLWEAHKAQLRRRLTRILQVDSRQRAERGATPLALEAAFGKHDEHRGRDVPPLELTLPRSGNISLAGFIDRVDQAKNGTLVVTDYKTGGGFGYDAIPTVGGKPSSDPDLVDRGRKLQLVLYGLAARREFGDPTTPVEGYYWFVEHGDLHRGGPVDPTAEQRLLEVLDVSVGAIRAGVFPAYPGAASWQGGWENCTYCPFQRVCPTTREEQWQAVKQSPPVQEYAAMADPVPEAAAETSKESQS
ncbi:PD-(D/E)XK nuclease family protein [Nocardioides pacificus]